MPGIMEDSLVDFGVRWAEIVAKHQMIEPGMSPAEVQRILGVPDREHELYEPKIYKGRRIGTTWFYLKRLGPEGQLGHDVIAVRFGLNNIVTEVDGWGQHM